MNNKIIKPLLVEVFTKEELIQRLRAENEINVRDLKMVNTIIKIPRMCTDFHKAMRQRHDENRLAEL